MPTTVEQITDLDAELDALESPTTATVALVTQYADPGIVATSAVNRALNAGVPANITGESLVITDTEDPSEGNSLLNVRAENTARIFRVYGTGEVYVDVVDPDGGGGLSIRDGTAEGMASGGRLLACSTFDGILFFQVYANNRVVIGDSTSTLGFYGGVAAAKPTGVPVTAEGIHAALVTLGLIAA